MHLHKYNYIESSSSAKLCGDFSCWCLASKHCSSSKAKKIYSTSTHPEKCDDADLSGAALLCHFWQVCCPLLRTRTKEFLIRNAFLEVVYLKICGFNNFFGDGGGIVDIDMYIYNFSWLPSSFVSLLLLLIWINMNM